MNSRLKARVEMIVDHINADPDGHGGPGRIRECLIDREKYRGVPWPGMPYRFRRDQNPCYTPKDAKALNLEPSDNQVEKNQRAIKLLDSWLALAPKPAEQKVRRFRAKDGSGTWEGTNDSGVLITRDGRSHPLLLSTILRWAEDWEEVTA